jgi:hypothetical protein
MQLSYVADWGAKLIVPIPTARIVEPGVPGAMAIGAPTP